MDSEKFFFGWIRIQPILWYLFLTWASQGDPSRIIPLGPFCKLTSLTSQCLWKSNLLSIIYTEKGILLDKKILRCMIHEEYEFKSAINLLRHCDPINSKHHQVCWIFWHWLVLRVFDLYSWGISFQKIHLPLTNWQHIITTEFNKWFIT